MGNHDLVGFAFSVKGNGLDIKRENGGCRLEGGD
jgi:hypothetical protein